MHRTPLAALGLAATLSLFSTAAAQNSRNVQLLGRLSPASFSSDYNDIWGYRNPANGKEYCLLGSEQGTHVIDCSDPSNPVQRRMIPTDNPFDQGNLWRDIKTYGPYAYVVSEAHGGMQIIDLHDPDQAFKVSTFGASRWSHAHNIALDVGTGLVYVCGTNNGTFVIDVRTNPTSPTVIHVEGSPYIHDLAAYDGYGYFCDQNGNRLAIYDISQLPASMPRLASVPLPGSSIAHSVWPSRDSSICMVANEVSGGPLSIWDVSNKRLPLLLSTITLGSSAAIPHNPFIRDHVAHVSYYTEGYRTVDLTDPRNPVEVGYYDASSFTPGTFHGAWGVYHEQPSGVIYVSDIENGLYVFKPKSTAARYGDASTGSLGRTPSIYAFGAPYLGNTRFAVDVEDAPATRPGVLVVGSGRASVALGNTTILVALASPTPVVVPVQTDAAGALRVPLPVPTSPSLAGGVVNLQCVLSDSAQMFDLSATQGLEFELFVR
jgi:choice-of-anchor B domain-containing protein